MRRKQKCDNSNQKGEIYYGKNQANRKSIESRGSIPNVCFTYSHFKLYINVQFLSKRDTNNRKTDFQLQDWTKMSLFNNVKTLANRNIELITHDYHNMQSNHLL